MSLSSDSPLQTPRVRRGISIGLALVFLTIFYFLVYHPYEATALPSRILAGYLEKTASAVGALLGFLDPAPVVRKDTIYGAFNMQVVLDCGALDVWAMLCAAVLATPTSFRWRAIGVGAGTVAIVAANLVRLFALYLIGMRSVEQFHFFHEDVFSFLFVVYTLALFALWLAKDPSRVAASLQPALKSVEEGA